MRYIPFFLYLALVVGAGLITVADLVHPGTSAPGDGVISLIAWWIVTLPWSLLSLFVLPYAGPAQLLLGKQAFVILLFLLPAGFVVLNFYLLYRFARREGGVQDVDDRPLLGGGPRSGSVL